MIGIKQITLLSILFLGSLSMQAQLIVRTDFNREKPWLKDYRTNEKWVDVSAVSNNPSVTAKVTWGKFGTVDIANTQMRSEALVLTVLDSTQVRNWNAALSSGC